MTPTIQWATLILVPALALGLTLSWSGLLMLPLGATLGIYVGLSSGEPFFSMGFKTMIAALCAVCALLFIIGMTRRQSLWGKALVVGSVYGWCLVGLMGFGPQ
jgi:hypothetical protein